MRCDSRAEAGRFSREGQYMADLRKLAVWDGNWVTPASDSTAASSVVKHALDPSAQPGPHAFRSYSRDGGNLGGSGVILPFWSS